MYRSGQILKTIAYSIGNTPIVYHFGVIWVDDETGEIFVLHNDFENGTIMDSLEQFLEEREIEEVQDSYLEQLTNNQLLERFESCQGDFDLLDYNCEHFIDCMMGDLKKSEQIVIYLLGAVLIYLILK